LRPALARRLRGPLRAPDCRDQPAVWVCFFDFFLVDFWCGFFALPDLAAFGVALSPWSTSTRAWLGCAGAALPVWARTGRAEAARMVASNLSFIAFLLREIVRGGANYG